ncbi:MAG: secretion system protein, partial [Alphaproteobacteria bacterium]
GYTAPSLITRRASTTVELAPGEAFMIAGLLRDNMLSTLEQLPGASEVPVLSALFRSTAYQRNETELVIAVTPYIVNPLSSGDIKLPTDDFRPATFMESVFFGALGAPGDDTPSAEGPIGFLVD